MGKAASRELSRSVAFFREESRVLADLVCARPDDELLRETPHYGWRTYDVLVHLCLLNRMARMSLLDADEFARQLSAFVAGTRAADGLAQTSEENFARLTAYENSVAGGGAPGDLVEAWLESVDALAVAFETRDADERVAWFGPPMRVTALVAARQMETWGYGQDVFDLLRMHRPETDRIRPIVEFAIRVFRYTFANNGLDVPETPPRLVLTAPSGATWEWNATNSQNVIQGPAVDFCLVSVQRRNVADTRLAVHGDIACQWMEIAQCIAGMPHPGPKPGERVWL